MIVSVFSKERQGKQLHQDQEEFTGRRPYKKRQKRHYTQTQDQDQEQEQDLLPLPDLPSNERQSRQNKSSPRKSESLTQAV